MAMNVYSRRRLLKGALLAPAFPFSVGAQMHPPPEGMDRPSLDPNTLAQFVDPLPLGEPARSLRMRLAPGSAARRVPFYRLAMRQIEAKLHRDLPPTRLWSYGYSALSPILETRSGQGLWVEWANELPAGHFLPVDHSLHGAEPDKPQVRTVVHVHGARVPPESDGYPEAWFEPGRSLVCYYPNEQDAAMLWYHDHAMGINRLNVYAGLLGLFFIRDGFEDRLSLPSGKYEVPLLLCDRLLDRGGQLYYPVSGDPKAPWIPELFGNITLVNGKILPYLDVEPRPYRLRILNGSNARFYYLGLGGGLVFQQIGSDQGLLPAPVSRKELTLAPGERADVLVDFSAHPGRPLVLHSDTSALVQFRVSRVASAQAAPLPKALRPLDRIPEAAAVKTRRLTLNEYVDLKGNTVLMLLNATRWHMPVTEKPVLGSTEIWELVNLTGDTHPIHLHMVRFQVLDRRGFEPFTYETSKTLRYTGPLTPPSPDEMGWKDTVRAEAKAVTRIIVRFEGYTGRYVWHCHILEHEDNDMMRPYEVIAAPPQAQS
ncbi:MAG TPA: multicopper oxidase domain-containing protein [Bryobacteraceae bacterium]|jgi:spore coat protein A|nr:multicopper oxidase domain-containing protein [Bryobacteraceae bacterium]